MLRAIIFDFNGIIVDDEPIHFELFRRVLGEEGIDLTEADYYARYLGFDDRGAFTAAYGEHGRSLDEKLLAGLIDRKAAYYQSEIRNKVRIFPGVEKLVTTLVPVLPLAVASGALRQEIDTILSTAGLLNHFTVIISAEDVNHGNPNRKSFLRLSDVSIRKLAIAALSMPLIVVVIEDSKEGIRGALRAGMKCLAVSNSHPPELLQEANAVVKSLEEVDLSLLQKLCA